MFCSFASAHILDVHLRNLGYKSILGKVKKDQNYRRTLFSPSVSLNISEYHIERKCRRKLRVSSSSSMLRQLRYV